MLVASLYTPAVRARRRIAAELEAYPGYRDYVLRDFDSMLRTGETPFFDKCEVVRRWVLELMQSFRDQLSAIK